MHINCPWLQFQINPPIQEYKTALFRLECSSDAALRIDENRTSYLDDKDKVVFAQANVSWNYKGPSDSEFKTIDDDIK